MSGPGVFGTEMHLTTFVICCLEFALLSYQLPNYFIRMQDKSRFRFLLLIFLFLYYNIVSGLLPDASFAIPSLLQLTLAYSGGIVLAIYYFFYLTAELDIRYAPIFNFRFLISTVSIVFILGYAVPWLIFEDIDTSRFSFMWYPVMLAAGLFFKLLSTVIRLGKNRDAMQPIHVRSLYLNYTGSFTMAMLPCIAFFGEFQTFEVAVTNLSLLFTSIAYIERWANQSRTEYAFLSQSGFENGRMADYELLEQLKPLSNREREIADLLLNERLQYPAIAEQLFITPKTVGKHASNIFKKVSVSNRAEFVQKFNRLQLVKKQLDT